MIEAANRPSIARAIDYLFNDTRSPWSNVFARENGYWLWSFWQTPLPLNDAFRKQALRGLEDNTLVGTINFEPKENWQSRGEAHIELKDGGGMGYGGSNGDPDTPPQGQQRSFRVSDLYAYHYSHYQNGPKFQLFWPEEKRDAGVLACRKWLEAMKAVSR